MERDLPKDKEWMNEKGQQYTKSVCSMNEYISVIYLVFPTFPSPIYF